MEEMMATEKEWGEIFDNPEHQRRADQRFEREQKIRTERSTFMCDFYEKSEQRRLAKTQMRSIRYFLTAMALGVAARFLGETSLTWMAWTAGALSVVFVLITAYGLGMIKEMKRR